MLLSMTRRFTRYKNYSLEQLKNWVEDAIHSEASPEEIYTTIIEAITDTLDNHRVYLHDSKELLSFFGGTMETQGDYWNPEYQKPTFKPKYANFDEQLKAEGYEYTPLSNENQETLIEEGDEKKKKLKLVE